MILPAVLLLAAADPASASAGALTVVARVAPACTVRSAAADVVVVCAGRTPYVVTRPGARPAPSRGPQGLTITF